MIVAPTMGDGNAHRPRQIPRPRIFWTVAALGLASVPWTPFLWGQLSIVLGPLASLVAPAALGLAGLACCGAIALSGRQVMVRSIGALVPIGIALSILAVPAHFPAERFHVVQYGLLAALAGWTWGSRVAPARWILLVWILGAVDEGIQGLVPTREFSWGDVLANTGGAWLGAAAWIGGSDRLRWDRSPFRVRWRLNWWAATICSAGFCLWLWNRPAPPPVILITVDSLRADALRKETMPFVTALADEGLLYANAYSVAPWTTPSLVSVHTGLIPPVHGVRAREDVADPYADTIGRILRREGYRAPDVLSMGSDPGLRELGLQRWVGGGGSVADAVEGWLSSDEPADAPFFLWLHLVEPHLPYELASPVAMSDAVSAVTSEMLVPRGSLSLDGEERSAVIRCYESGVRSADGVIRSIAQLLDDRGLWDRSLVIITADHGEELGERGDVGHASTTGRATMFEEVLRIPMVVRWPGHLPRGKVIKSPVQQVDILPSICHWLGLNPPPGIDGRPLPTEDGHGDRMLLFESNRAGYQDSPDAPRRWIFAGLREGRKVILGNGVDRDLGYDLRSDPQESSPLSIDGSGGAPWGMGLAGQVREAFTTAEDRGKQRASRNPPPVPENLDGCPQVLFPREAVTLVWPRDDRIVLEWDGPDSGRYVVEYEIGSGEYFLSGTLEFDGTRQEFGPFTAEMWARLARYSPWKFRVRPLGDPGCRTPWRSFDLDMGGSHPAGPS